MTQKRKRKLIKYVLCVKTKLLLGFLFFNLIRFLERGKVKSQRLTTPSPLSSGTTLTVTIIQQFDGAQPDGVLS